MNIFTANNDKPKKESLNFITKNYKANNNKIKKRILHFVTKNY